MSIMGRLAQRDIRLNKKRSVGIIVGIMLSVSLIVAITGLGSSFIQSMIENQKQSSGPYHMALYNLSEEDVETIRANQDLDEVIVEARVGYAKFDYNYELLPYISIKSFSGEDTPEKVGYTLIEGKLATKKDELVLSLGAASDSGYKVGDTIELEIGSLPENIDDSGNVIEPFTQQFKITGIIDRSGNYGTYEAFTTGYESTDYTSYVTFLNPGNYKQDVAELLGIDSINNLYESTNGQYDFYSINHELLAWEALDFGDGTLKVILAIVSVLVFIIVTTSVFSIRNSFAISTSEKIKTLGMITSIGATKKQIKKQLLTETFLLGLVGIPLGVLFGVLLNFLFIKLVNNVLPNLLGSTSLPFLVSWQGIVIASLLGMLTIYLSAQSSLKRTSKISPIELMRESNEVKMPTKALKTPALIHKIFGMGGVIAYKNLKRSGRKYRTTIISLTVTVFAFLSLSTFSSRMLSETTKAYEMSEYNLSFNQIRNLTPADLEEIEAIEGVEKMRTTYILTDSPYIDLLDQDVLNEGGDPINLEMLGVVALDEEFFQKYANELSIDTDFNGGILYDWTQIHDENQQPTDVRIYNYETNDVIHGFINNKTIEIEVQIANKPQYKDDFYYIHNTYLLLNKETYQDTLEFIPYSIDINAKDPSLVVEKITEMSPKTLTYNMEAEVQQSKTYIQLLSYFVYGFIGIITLIGVTSIFNTITSNMTLRQSEFAMLRSVGMTQSEFNQMINLETLFYSTQSLILGIIFGILGSLAIQFAFNTSPSMEASYSLPLGAIHLAFIFVFVIVFTIMRYSINKLKQQNIIETIRKTNH